MASKKKKDTASVEITPLVIQRGRVVFNLVGNTPLIYNAMSFKSRTQLLKPSGRKTAAEKATTLKHNPIEEYRSSVYRRQDGDVGPTRLILPAIMFKKALSNVAVRIPGSKKTEINQLTWVEGVHVDLYGVPQLFMSVVRSADMNRTPDIRTRAIVPEWACRVSIQYVQPMLNGTTVSTLLEAAGLLMGVGDFRQEKGSGSFGQFRQVADDDVDFLRIVAEGGMDAQDKSLSTPATYDQETEELFSWFTKEASKMDPNTISA